MDIMRQSACLHPEIKHLSVGWCLGFVEEGWAHSGSISHLIALTVCEISEYDQ